MIDIAGEILGLSGRRKREHQVIHGNWLVVFVENDFLILAGNEFQIVLQRALY